MLVNIILKLVEETPMQFSFVCSSTPLALKNIVNNKKSSSKFKALAEGLSQIKIVDMAKF